MLADPKWKKPLNQEQAVQLEAGLLIATKQEKSFFEELPETLKPVSNLPDGGTSSV